MRLISFVKNGASGGGILKENGVLPLKDLGYTDAIAFITAGEPAMAGAVFFPMHRVERMELDAVNGEFPSLAQRFADKTGKSVDKLFDARRTSRGQGAR